jgi:hypothetical protein
MANIQNLYVVKAEDGSVVNAITAYDLSAIVGGVEVPKQVEAKYVVNNGGVFTEYSYNVAGSEYLTKVTNPATGEYAYLKESPGTVSELLSNASCDSCAQEGSPVTIETSCDNPLFVKICDFTSNDRELVFTDSEPICVDNNGVTTTWLVRERIVWDSVTYTEISRVTEYSQNGLSWSTTAPTGTITVGGCAQPVSECELIVTSAIPICVKHTGSTTSTDCCNINVALYRQWLTREKILWDSGACAEISKTVEYSEDGVTWVTTVPCEYIIGECPDESPILEECCEPEICEAFADDLSTLCPAHNFIINKPSCCKIKVTTSIGTFHVIEGAQSYTTSDFNCLVEITNVEIVSGTCTLDKIQIVGNKLK